MSVGFGIGFIFLALKVVFDLNKTSDSLIFSINLPFLPKALEIKSHIAAAL